MKHIGLFEGIGGFSLAAEQSGWETVAWCEINEFCQKVLGYHFPNAKGFGDIKTTDFKKYANKIDILTGGFPCQPYSTAGKRKGKEDDRHLWPEMLRAIREIRPRWVVGENVRGLVNWSGGLVFDEVQADLENEGYEVLPFLLPACAVGAPHRRERVWFVAYASSEGLQKSFCEQFGGFPKKKRTQSGCKPKRIYAESNEWGRFPAQSPVRGGNDGIPAELDGISVSDWCTESIKAYGNAIVPQVAMQIFKAINEIQKANHGMDKC